MSITSICPVCGTEIQPGVTTCPVCGCDMSSGDNDALIGLIQNYIDKGQNLLALKLLNDSGRTGGEYDRLRAQLQEATTPLATTPPPPPPLPAPKTEHANQSDNTSATQTVTNATPVETEIGFLPHLRMVSLLAVYLVPMVALPLLAQLMPDVFYEMNDAGVTIYYHIHKLFMVPLYFFLAVYALKGRAAAVIGWVCTGLAVTLFFQSVLQAPLQTIPITIMIICLLMACCARPRYRAPLIVLTVFGVLDFAFYTWGLKAFFDSCDYIPQTTELYTAMRTIMDTVYVFAWAWLIYVSMTETKNVANTSAQEPKATADMPVWAKVLGIVGGVSLLMAWPILLCSYGLYIKELAILSYVLNGLGLLLLAGIVVAYAMKAENMVVKVTGFVAGGITALVLLIKLAYDLSDTFDLNFQDFILCNLAVIIICGGWFWAAKCLSKGAMRGAAAYAVIVLMLAITPMVISLSDNSFSLFINMTSLLTIESAIIILPIALAFPRLNKIAPALISFGVLSMLMVCYFVSGLFSSLTRIYY